MFHDLHKHKDIRFQFNKECITNKEIKLTFVKSLNQVIEICTKPLKSDSFQKLQMTLGVGGNSSLRGDVGK